MSPLSMDAAYDPEPTLNVSPRPVGGAGPVRCAARILRYLAPPASRAHPDIAPSPRFSRRSYATVILRAISACREPSLSPRESIQWASYVVVKIMARIARAHPHPAVFEPLVVGMASLASGGGARGAPSPGSSSRSYRENPSLKPRDGPHE